MAVSKDQLILELKARGITLTKTQLKSLNKTVDSTAASTTAATAAFAAMAVGAYALGRALSSAITTGIEFNATMAEVKAISRANEEQFNALRQSALDFGIQSVYTASQVGELQVELTKLGFSITEIENVTKGILDLAAATGDDLANSASVAGETLRAFGLDSTEMNDMVDIMGRSFVNSALDITKFSESMKYVAPLAKQAGFSVADTTAILGQLANAGISGSMAGTALRKIFLEMGNESSKLAKRVGFPIRSMDDLKKAMLILKQQGFDPLTEGADLVGQRAVTAFSIMYDSVGDIEKLNETLNDTSVSISDIAEDKLDNLEGDLIKNKAAFENLSIQITDVFDPAMRGLTQATTAWINTIQPGDLKAYAAGYTIAGGAVLYLKRAMIAKYWATIKATAALQGMKKAMIATGWGALAVAIGTVVGWLLDYFNVVGSNEPKIDSMNDALDDTIKKHDEEKETVEAVTTAYKNYMDKLDKIAGSFNLGELVEEADKTLLNDLTNEFNDLTDQFSDSNDKIKDLKTDLDEFLSTARSGKALKGTIKLFGLDDAESLAAFRGQFSEMEADVNHLKEQFGDAFNVMVLSGNEFEPIANIVHDIGTGSDRIYGTFGELIHATGGVLKNAGSWNVSQDKANRMLEEFMQKYDLNANQLKRILFSTDKIKGALEGQNLEIYNQLMLEIENNKLLEQKISNKQEELDLESGLVEAAEKRMNIQEGVRDAVFAEKITLENLNTIYLSTLQKKNEDAANQAIKLQLLAFEEGLISNITEKETKAIAKRIAGGEKYKDILDELYPALNETLTLEERRSAWIQKQTEDITKNLDKKIFASEKEGEFFTENHDMIKQFTAEEIAMIAMKMDAGLSYVDAVKEALKSVRGVSVFTAEGNEEEFEAMMTNFEQIEEHINQVGDLMSQYAQANIDRYKEQAQAAIDQINRQEAAELDALRNSAKYKFMSDKQKKAAEEKIQADMQKLRDKEKADANKKIKEQFKIQQAAKLAQIAMNTAQAVMNSVATMPFTLSAGMPWSGIAIAMGAAQAGLVLQQKAPTMREGGLIGGKSHEMGGTPLIAEEGEYIMNRDAVENIGEEAMDRINQGSGAINVSFAGNVMSDDFLVDEAVPKIKEILRQGGDLGND